MQNNPLLYVDFWDFVILILGVFIRFGVVVSAKLKLHTHEFSMSKYLDQRHLIRWSIHLIVSITGLLVFPQVFVTMIAPRYFEFVNSWTYLFSAMVGFAGYDLIKFIEKITFSIVRKLGVEGGVPS